MERRALLSATPMDFNGDGKADFYVYNQSTATFAYSYSGSPGVTHSLQLGDPSHDNIVTIADYDGDGRADFSVFDRNTATYLVNLSSSGTQKSVSIGDPSKAVSLVPVPADYTGDGRADFAIWDKTGATYFVKPSSDPTTGFAVAIGDPSHTNSILPVPADYNGDGKTDFAIYDKTGAVYFVKPADNLGAGFAVAIGDPSRSSGITPVPADYNGDGAADFAIFVSTGSTYFVKPSSNPFTGYAVAIGDPSRTNSILPVPADYNGDGAADFAIYDKTVATYFIKPSINVNAGYAVSIGDPSKSASITPVPAEYTTPGVADFAIYDGLAAAFFVKSASNPASPITSYVGGTSHVYEPIGGATADINSSSTTDPLILYDHTTSTFIAPVIPSTIAGQPARPNTLQFGDPSHVNIPVINAKVSLNGDSAYDALILYDKTTSTFIAPPLTSGLIGLPSRANTLQFGDPSHDNVPLVNVNIDLNGDGKAEPLILYDRTTSTFIAPPLSAGLGNVPPPPHTLQVGDPSHNNIPIVNAIASINGSSMANSLMIYDQTTATFIAPQLNSGIFGQPPIPNTLPLGNPAHQNIPIINANVNLNGAASNNSLIVYDQTTSIFIAPVIPSGLPGGMPRPNTLALGDPSHISVPIINSGANLNGDNLTDALVVFDPVASTFYSPLLPNLPNQPPVPNSLPLGDPSHKNIPISASGAKINGSSSANPLIVYDPIASMFIAPPQANVLPGQSPPPYTLSIGVVSPGARQNLPGRRYVFSQTT